MSRGTNIQSRIPESDGSDTIDEQVSNDWFGEDDASEDRLIGKTIDNRYMLLALIGQGGMGSVYKAEHLGIRRMVALKLLHPSLASVPEVKSRFEREAFAIGRIEHPNCVNVSDFGKLDDGSLYLVMEYLEGRSLGDELADHRRIEPLRAVRILRHVLRGLGHAHENDIVHRDVKPENVVLVAQDGDPDFAKILDFGIAKLMGAAAADDGGVKLTQAGMAFGTPIYMSPEQAVGNPVDGRADLYAASVMAYEMITGQPPFQSDDKIEVMSMHTTRPVPPMSEIAPDIQVPPAVEQLLARGLAKRPRDRYADAASYVAAIDALLSGQAVPPVGQFTDTPLTGMNPMHAVSLPMQTQGTQQLAELAESLTRRNRRMRKLATVGLMLAGLVGIAIAIVATMDRGNRQEQSPLAEAAEEALELGEPSKAIEILKQDEQNLEHNADALLQLGHAYSKTREDAKALEQYEAAIARDRNMTKNGELRANLRVMMNNSEDPLISLQAADLLASRLDDEAARDKIVALASTHKRSKVRQKALALASALGVEDRVDKVAGLLLDLRDGKNCTARKEVVGQLRAAGDKRAIPELRKAARRKRGRKKINRCLAKQALEAAKHLEALQEISNDADAPLGAKTGAHGAAP